jgi:UDP-glucose 4-epimerase
MPSESSATLPKCLVLGGGGFMGLHLCKALLARGYPVRAFERPVIESLSTERSRGPIEWVYGDFLNQNDVATAVSGCDIVFHLISTTLPKNSNDNPLYDVETNLSGTLGMLEAARAAGASRIIFVSSGGTVYGVPREIPISESHPTDPICSYGITKLAIEKYLHLYHKLHGLDYFVLRIANPYGEGQRPDSAQGVVAVFLNRAISGQPIEIWGDGNVVRDYLYVADVMEGFMRAVDYRGDCRIMNIGSTRGHSVNELLKDMEDLIGRRIERIHLPARPFDVPINVLDCTLARDLLGWEPRVSLREGLARTLQWLEQSSRSYRRPPSTG